MKNILFSLKKSTKNYFAVSEYLYPLRQNIDLFMLKLDIRFPEYCLANNFLIFFTASSI